MNTYCTVLLEVIIFLWICSESIFSNETTSVNQVIATFPEIDFVNETNPFFLCGANQCSANENISNDTIKEEKYFIKNWSLKLILFVFFGALQVMALLFHVFLLDDTQTSNLPKLDSSVYEDFLKNNNEDCKECSNLESEQTVKVKEKWVSWFKVIEEKFRNFDHKS